MTEQLKAWRISLNRRCGGRDSDPRCRRGRAGSETGVITDILTDFKAYCENVKRKSYKTVLDRSIYLRRFLNHCKKPLEAISTNEIMAFLKAYNGSSVHDHFLKALRLAYEWKGLGDRVKDFSFEGNDEKPIVVPSDEDIKAFFYALPDLRAKALYLFYATSGKRKMEALTLNKGELNLSTGIILREKSRNSRTKREWVSFENEESLEYIKFYLAERKDENPKLFPIGWDAFNRIWKEAHEITGVKITPQVLREWFCDKMGRLGMRERYIDAFCGRTPKSVLAKHYTDYNPRRMEEEYKKAGLRVLA